MILMLNAMHEKKFGDAIAQSISSEGIDVSHIDLEAVTLRPCLNCGECTKHHTHACIFKDDGVWLMPQLLEAAKIIILSPITYGSYSFLAKRVIDKFALIMDRRYAFEKGEITKFGMATKRFNFSVVGISNTQNSASQTAFKRLHEENLRITRGIGQCFIVDETHQAEAVRLIGKAMVSDV